MNPLYETLIQTVVILDEEVKKTFLAYGFVQSIAFLKKKKNKIRCIGGNFSVSTVRKNRDKRLVAFTD